MTQAATQSRMDDWQPDDIQEGGVPDGTSEELAQLLAKDISIPTPLAEALTRAEIGIQSDAALKHPRSITDFQAYATNIVTLNPAVARSCYYIVPRGGKELCGPSIRMAEIVASAWGNLRVDTRIVEIGEDAITARGVCLDLERNNAQTVEVRKSILDKHGRRFNQDMIGVTAMSAISFARRNSILAVVPRALVEPLVDIAKSVVGGRGESMEKSREKWANWAERNKVPPERFFAALGIAGMADFTAEHVVKLTGLITALKEGSITRDDAFPDPDAPPSDKPARGKQSTQSRLDALKGNGEQHKPEPTRTEPKPDNKAPAESKQQEPSKGQEPAKTGKSTGDVNAQPPPETKEEKKPVKPAAPAPWET